MMDRLFNWLRGSERTDLDAQRRWVSRQHERAARRAIVTGVDTTIRCVEAKDAMEALLGRMEKRDAKDG